MLFLPDAAADKPRWSGSPLLLRAGPHGCGLRAVHGGQTWLLSAAGIRDPLPWLCSQVAPVTWLQIKEVLSGIWRDPLRSPLCRWQFATEGADIGFGVFLKERKGEWKKATQMQEVLPSQRYNAHLVPEDGSLTCRQPGVCKWAPAPNRQECWSSLLILLGLSQMFWDSITLTASSKLKESASPLKCCCLTTRLVRRLLEWFKTHKLTTAAIQNQGDIGRAGSAATPEHNLTNLIYIYMLSACSM